MERPHVTAGCFERSRRRRLRWMSSSEKNKTVHVSAASRNNGEVGGYRLTKGSWWALRVRQDSGRASRPRLSLFFFPLVWEDRDSRKVSVGLLRMYNQNWIPHWPCSSVALLFRWPHQVLQPKSHHPTSRLRPKMQLIANLSIAD